MNKLQILSLLFILLTILSVGGCTISEEREDNFFTTEKTTTKIGGSGIEKESKECPFWDREC